MLKKTNAMIVAVVLAVLACSSCSSNAGAPPSQEVAANGSETPSDAADSASKTATTDSPAPAPKASLSENGKQIATADAIVAAVSTMQIFTTDAFEQDKWFSLLKPTVTDAAAKLYENTDPQTIKATTFVPPETSDVTLDAADPLKATVTVSTDAGTYILQVESADELGSWKTSSIEPK